MNKPTESTFDLSKRVYDIITQYVYRRTEARSRIRRAEFKDKRVKDEVTGRVTWDVPPEYQKTQGAVCQDAFLAMRACRSREDFVSYFTGTICAIGQFLPLTDYQVLAGVLLGDDDGWEQVKALSMLALSAHSYVQSP